MDTFRKQHPGVIGYTYWGYRHGGRASNKGIQPTSFDFICKIVFSESSESAFSVHELYNSFNEGYKFSSDDFSFYPIRCYKFYL